MYVIIRARKRCACRCHTKGTTVATPIPLRGTVQYGCSFLVISLGILFMFILLCIFFPGAFVKN